MLIVLCVTQREARDRKQLQLSTRNKLRDKRLQSARVRKYYEEFQVRQRSRLLKKRTKEELVIKSSKLMMWIW